MDYIIDRWTHNYQKRKELNMGLAVTFQKGNSKKGNVDPQFKKENSLMWGWQ